MDFTIEVERSMRVLDGAAWCIAPWVAFSRSPKPCGVRRPSTSVPRLAFRTRWTAGANFFKAVDQMKTRLKANPVPVGDPDRRRRTFKGVVDLPMKAIIWDEASQGMKFEYHDIPADLVAAAEEWRASMMSEAEGQGEELMNKYLERRAVEKRSSPVICSAFLLIQADACGSAFKNKGVQRMLDAVIQPVCPLADRHSAGRRR